MIILVAFLGICFVAYSFWVVDEVIDRFSSFPFCMLVGLFFIMMPLAIIAQILTWMGVLK